MELGDWASEKLSGRVQLEGHSPKWQALQNFSFQPCIYIICLTYGINTFMVIVEEIVSLYRVLEYNRDMFALRYPLNINYRLFETLKSCEHLFFRKIVSCRDRFVIPS